MCPQQEQAHPPRTQPKTDHIPKIKLKVQCKHEPDEPGPSLVLGGSRPKGYWSG